MRKHCSSPPPLLIYAYGQPNSTHSLCFFFPFLSSSSSSPHAVWHPAHLIPDGSCQTDLTSPLTPHLHPCHPTHTNSHARTCLRTHMCAHTHAHAHTRRHAHTHTHTHTHTHMQIHPHTCRQTHTNPCALA